MGEQAFDGAVDNIGQLLVITDDDQNRLRAIVEQGREAILHEARVLLSAIGNTQESTEIRERSMQLLVALMELAPEHQNAMNDLLSQLGSEQVTGDPKIILPKR